MKKKLLLSLMMGCMVLGAKAQSYVPAKAPELEFALQLKVTLGETFGIDNTQHGRRTVILNQLSTLRQHRNSKPHPIAATVG